MMEPSPATTGPEDAPPEAEVPAQRAAAEGSQLEGPEGQLQAAEAHSSSEGEEEEGTAEEDDEREDNSAITLPLEGASGSGARRQRHASAGLRPRRRARDLAVVTETLPGVEADDESMASMARLDGFEWVPSVTSATQVSIATPPSEAEHSFYPTPRPSSSGLGTEEDALSTPPTEEAPRAEEEEPEARGAEAAPPAGEAASRAPEAISARTIAASAALVASCAVAGGLLWRRRRHARAAAARRASSAQRGPYRILLLGQTGSGKTKLLDLLCNWAKLRHLQKGSAAALVDRLQSFHKQEFESAKEKAMSSKTDRASIYPVCFDDLSLEIIDSPGFADTRGLEYDQQHIRDIVGCLKEVEYLNCIFLVINGRASRMTTMLKYVLTQVCSIMPRTILQQVYVVFTNTSDDLQLNFDISQLRPYFDDNIAQQYVVLENPLASIEKAVNNTCQIPKQRLSCALGSTLEQSFGALTEMFARITKFGPVHTVDFMKLYHARQRVEKRTMDLLAEYDHITNVIASVQNLEAEIQAAIRQKSLYKNFKTTQRLRKHRTVNTRRHNTLCGYPGCYSNCHAPCNLPKSMDKKVFRHCAAMGHNHVCRACGHSFEHHYHDEVSWVEELVEEELVDEAMKRHFQHAEHTEQRLERLLQAASKRLESLERTKTSLAAELKGGIAEFEQHAALRPYNKLLIHQIDILEQAIQAFTDEQDQQERHQALKATQEWLEKKLRIVNEALGSSAPPPPPPRVVVQAQEATGVSRL